MSAGQIWLLLIGLGAACVGLMLAACEKRRIRGCAPRPPGVDRRRRPRQRERKHNGEHHA